VVGPSWRIPKAIEMIGAPKNLLFGIRDNYVVVPFAAESAMRSPFLALGVLHGQAQTRSL
jgi:hypothetical protein